MNFITLLFFNFFIFNLFFSCATKRPLGVTEAEVLLKEAKEMNKAGQYMMALERLNHLKTRHPYSYHRAEAELVKADVLFNQENYAEATATYKVFRDLYPKHPQTEYVLWKIGESYFRLLPGGFDKDISFAQSAIEYFQKLLTEYPNSQFKEEASKLLKECQELLENYELYVGNFYYKTGEYSAARYRFEKALKKFPSNSPHLFYMKQKILQSSVKAKKQEDCLKDIETYKIELSSWEEYSFLEKQCLHLAKE